MISKFYNVKKIIPGQVKGEALIAKERYSFQGFIDPKKGIFHAPQSKLCGYSIKGAVLIFISGKGSSAGAAALDLACRYGNAPGAVINFEIEPFMVASCALNDIPMFQLEDLKIFDEVEIGDKIEIDTKAEKIYVLE